MYQKQMYDITEVCKMLGISHFGYKIDMSDSSSIYTRIDFPNELINTFTNFIKGGNEQ